MIRGAHHVLHLQARRVARLHPRQAGYSYTDVGDGGSSSTPEADMGRHPTDKDARKACPPARTTSPSATTSKTVAELKAKGVALTDSIKDAGYGLTHFKMPGDFEVGCQLLYKKG
jgi:hypothetical protein